MPSNTVVFLFPIAFGASAFRLTWRTSSFRNHLIFEKKIVLGQFEKFCFMQQYLINQFEKAVYMVKYDMI